MNRHLNGNVSHCFVTIKRNYNCNTGQLCFCQVIVLQSLGFNDFLQSEFKAFFLFHFFNSQEPAPSYDVPSYEEAVTSGQYPIRQSNLRQSTSQLPSYEDLITAVENDGGQNTGSDQNPPAAR